MSMVHLKAVEKKYGDVVAVEPTDLVIEKGEFVTLLGPSGSGKTTLLNIIAGMTPPTRGEVWIEGRDMTETPSSKRGLGMVFQNYALMPHMTVFENIAFPLQIRRMPREQITARVMEVLEMVRLAHVAKRKPRELSGGQQQRISLARCIAYSPSLILMDEPLGALDRKLREQMQIEIKRLHTQLGVTMLYVTHDQEEALTMSDRIILMNNARIEQIGTPHDLYFKPNSVFAADFIGLSNLIRGVVAEGGSIELPDGRRLPIPSADDAKQGDSVRLMIRPENIRMTPERNGDAASLAGTVLSTLFAGGVAKHYVDIGSGEPLIVQETISRQPLGAERGRQVHLTWDPDDARVLQH